MCRTHESWTFLKKPRKSLEEEKRFKSLVPDQTGNKTPVNRHQENITNRTSRIHEETLNGY